ncbi:MAG TPA: hypothetical protein VJ436_14230 [Anaerolineales bacterium]|nr:hypothetical protein [Anaerolineales bacterium]
MQTCSICNAQSPNLATQCGNCGSDLRELSATAMALKRFRANPRVIRVRVEVMDDACPACAGIAGAYSKDEAPRLPVEGCSYKLGCRCFYQPYLDEIYP